jgi:hypothetical protein
MVSWLPGVLLSGGWDGMLLLKFFFVAYALAAFAPVGSASLHRACNAFLKSSRKAGSSGLCFLWQYQALLHTSNAGGMNG